jgi:hypothetical protein
MTEAVNGIRQWLKMGGKTPTQLQAAQDTKKDKWKADSDKQAGAYTTGALPYEQTGPGQAEAQKTADAIKVIEARNANEGWTKNGSPVQVAGRWMQPFTNKAGENKMEPMPEGYTGPAAKTSQSQYSQQRATFAQSIGKTPETMTWGDEQAFLAQRYKAGQPYAQKKMAIEEQKLGIAQASLALRRSQTDWKEFEDTFKQLSPMEKLQTTAELADDYTKDPTGPGDVALTLAYFEVAKAADPGSGSGIRFTQQEMRMITGARGWADAAQANVQRWGKGTLYDDKQRAQMAQVVKMAADKSKQHEQQLLDATGSMNPKASDAAAVAAGAPEGPKTKALKQKAGAKSLADRLNDALGK